MRREAAGARNGVQDPYANQYDNQYGGYQQPQEDYSQQYDMRSGDDRGQSGGYQAYSTQDDWRTNNKDMVGETDEVVEDPNI